MRTKAILLGVITASTCMAQALNNTSTTGYVTDTFCGRRGANHLHGERARNEVAAGKAKYAIYDEKSKQLYILEPQETAAQYAGQRVRITGTLSETPITRAGQTYAPDAVATYKSPAGDQRPVNAVSGDSSPSAQSSPSSPSGVPRVQSQEKALDKSTRVAGLLAIASVEANPR